MGKNSKRNFKGVWGDYKMRNRKGEWCPFADILCQEGYCDECMVYLEYEKKLAKKVKNENSIRLPQK